MAWNLETVGAHAVHEGGQRHRDANAGLRHGKELGDQGR